MDIMEQLLCPQISMDVEDTPLQLDTTDNVDAQSDTSEDLSEEDKIKMLLETPYFDSSQTPEDLTVEEEALKKTLFSVGPAVQFMKLHCTSCNTHLGSAPLKQFERFIHPLLHVILCKTCYDFYTSGDFEKDEDGSELYCRWCGQGGKVMCCADCCYVFCQKCVRNNLGKKTLDGIKNSDDWKCFICNPQQIINHKLICHSLFQFVQSEISNAKITNNTDRLKIDHSFCCSKPKTPKQPLQQKRKRSISAEDNNYNPKRENLDLLAKKKKTPPTSVLQKVLSSFKRSNNMSTVQTPILPVPPPNQQKYLKVKILPTQQYGNHNPLYMPNPMQRPPKMLFTSTHQPVTNSMLKTHSFARGSQNFIPCIAPGPACSKKAKSHVLNVSVPPSINPGLTHAWFDQAASITNNITSNLTKKLSTFTTEQKNAKSIEQLANIHNKLQELLSSSVNSLIQVRKNLRNEFLTDLKKMKSSENMRKESLKPNPLYAPLSNDDVIVINNDDEESAADPLNCGPPPLVPLVEKPRGFLKVKPVNTLMDASRLSEMNSTRTNGVTEQIDLCDDDDDDIVQVPESATIDSTIVQTSPVVENNVNSIDFDESEKVVSNDNVERENNSKKDTPEENIPEIDKETQLQIQRALAESKYESIIENNCKVKINKLLNISSKELNRMLTVRVILHPGYKPIRKKPLIEKIVEKPDEVQDFEEMLSGTIVVNRAVLKVNDEAENKTVQSTLSASEEIIDTISEEDPQESIIAHDNTNIIDSEIILSDDENEDHISVKDTPTEVNTTVENDVHEKETRFTEKDNVQNDDCEVINDDCEVINDDSTESNEANDDLEKSKCIDNNDADENFSAENADVIPDKIDLHNNDDSVNLITDDDDDVMDNTTEITDDNSLNCEDSDTSKDVGGENTEAGDEIIKELEAPNSPTASDSIQTKSDIPISNESENNEDYSSIENTNNESNIENANNEANIENANNESNIENANNESNIENANNESNIENANTVEPMDISADPIITTDSGIEVDSK